MTLCAIIVCTKSHTVMIIKAGQTLLPALNVFTLMDNYGIISTLNFELPMMICSNNTITTA